MDAGVPITGENIFHYVHQVDRVLLDDVAGTGGRSAKAVGVQVSKF